jgi:hypothetical protein
VNTRLLLSPGNTAARLQAAAAPYTTIPAHAPCTTAAAVLNAAHLHHQ